jgi:hypothetical protein
MTEPKYKPLASVTAMNKENLERQLAMTYQQCTLNVRARNFDRAVILAEKASDLHIELCKLD